MLFKNIIRTIWTKPVQFFSLVVLIAMSSLTYVSLHNAINSLDYFLNDYANTMKQEDFLVVLDPPNDASVKELIQKKGISPLEMIDKTTDQLIKTYEYDLVDYYTGTVERLEAEYGATIEGRFYRDIVADQGDKSNTYRVIKQTDAVNLTYVIQGMLPSNPTHIAVFEQYANENGLNIGDSITINDKSFNISGFIAVPDYIYPIFNYDSPMFEPDRETIAIVDDSIYDQFAEKQWVLYSGYFNDGQFSEDRVKAISGEKGVSYALGKNLNVRISTVYTDMASNELLASVFSNFILIMSIFVIILILRKRLDADRIQIGILKAMGYSNFKISINYALYPVFAAIVGTWIGFFAGSGISVFLSNYYVSHYVVPNVSVYYSANSLINGVIYPIVLIAVASFIILIILLNKKPLQLMKEDSHLKTSKLSKLVSNCLSPLSFETRFRYSLAFRNMGKISALFFAVLIASIFLVFASIAFNSLDSVVQKAFGQANYDYQVRYNKKINQPLTMLETPFIEAKAELYSSFVLGEEEVKYEASTPFIIYGTEPNNFINPLVNKRGEDITLFTKKGFIINEFIAKAYSLSIDDSLTVIINGKFLTLPIVEIVDHYNGPMVYMDINKLGDFMNFKTGYYNGKWTDTRPVDEKDVMYSFSVTDLERNLDIAMEMINVSLVGMMIVAIILGFVIMTIIANFVIDENQKQISILKVMGYNEKEISNMVLTIYFPFILLAYFISIPFTRFGIDFIMAKIAAQLPFAIPTDFTWIQCVVGLLIVVITYSIALGVSKVQLKKISLQEVLKY
ncbi:MAG: FtsX-like permease family protein [Turicibacter sp.]